jgi:arabinogalactan endo-1,4-beta-galactosidase
VALAGVSWEPGCQLAEPSFVTAPAPPPVSDGQAEPPIRGADISFTTQEERAGNQVSEGGVTEPIETILDHHGANYVRLRLWVDPPTGDNDETATLQLARRARATGMKIYLDFHYSDTWADPTHQTVPAPWNSTDIDVLSRQLRTYTRDVLEDFARQGTPIDLVQLGNEVSGGILWPLGQLGQTRPGGGWPGFLALMRAAVSGVREAEAADHHRVAIAIHSDRVNDIAGLNYFFGRLRGGGVPFDVIALSYYPFWHGPLSTLAAAMDDLATTFGKDVIVAETAYPWTLEEGDPLFVAAQSALPEAQRFPPTPGGQSAYFRALRAVINQVPARHGLGFLDWEPGWLPGVGVRAGQPDAFANLTMFDFHGHMLPAVLAAFAPSAPARS